MPPRIRLFEVLGCACRLSSTTFDISNAEDRIWRSDPLGVPVPARVSLISCWSGGVYDEGWTIHDATPISDDRCRVHERWFLARPRAGWPFARATTTTDTGAGEKSRGFAQNCAGCNRALSGCDRGRSGGECSEIRLGQ